MKIATYNVNSLRARLSLVKDWLRKESPDMLCIQETKVPDESFPRNDLEALGYDVAFCGEKTYNGVAIISATPLDSVLRGFTDGTGGTRLIAADVRGVHIVNTYVPQGVSPFTEKFREKLDWLERLFDYFRERFTPAKPVLWVGDFNIAPEPIDVYDPVLLDGHVSFNDEVRAMLERFRQWGFIDVFRLHHSEGGHYSFWDYMIKNPVKKGMGWRIDHIWATKTLARKSKDAWIDIDARLS
ncbi:MAG: exodeoxyribonuclease III, partial [bacterium]